MWIIYMIQNINYISNKFSIEWHRMGKHNSRAGYLVANREEAPNTDKHKYIIQYALYAIIFYILETYAAKKKF